MTVCVLALLWVHKTGRHPWEWLWKPLAAATFIAAGAQAGLANSSTGAVMLLGLVLAAGGDVLLIPKSKLAFLGGLGSFLLGHVAYAVSFAMRGVDATVTLLCLGLLALVAVVVMRWLWPHVEGPMRGPVLAYVAVITTMVALAVGAAWHGSSWWLVVGATAFYLSDLSVARDRFVKEEFLNRAWGLPLYFGAQLLLATSG